MDIRFRKIRSILLAILLLNWIVAFIKIIYGHAVQSIAICADGLHSFSDGASNLVGLTGIWVASRPKDKDHPYGHKKYETFAAIIIAIILFLISYNIIRNGIDRFLHPAVSNIDIASFIVMLVTVAVNAAVYLYEKSRAAALSSDILLADAEHTKSDILVSISVICALIAVKIGFPVIEPVVSVCIALMIAYSAVIILKESSGVLCDKSVMDEDPIRSLVLGFDDVKGCHKIRTRGRRDDVHIDLHIAVDADMPIGKAHDLNHRIEEKIKADIKNVTDIVIHIEPFI
ncbi:MAG: cation diffusion facilitator family transporter [Candidatus Omnitrophica bacterium]|nr:cation diffusion facilitator family transporter [Candidatus Omnitrophota bacterium]